MKIKMNRKLFVGIAGTLALAGVGGAQLGNIGIREVLKVGGVILAVNTFGKQMNSGLNKLTGHRDTQASTTKIVPIITGGINERIAIGAAQIMGPRAKVNQVKAVAQLEQDILGREVRIRALIPISSDRIIQNLRRVDGVGVSGIVDLRLARGSN